MGQGPFQRYELGAYCIVLCLWEGGVLLQYFCGLSWLSLGAILGVVTRKLTN